MKKHAYCATSKATSIVATLMVVMVAATSFAGIVRFPTPAEIVEEQGVALDAASLIGALSHPKADVRQAAATLLGDLAIREAVPALQTALDDSFVYTRLAAAGSLLRMKFPTGLPVVERALQSKDKFEMTVRRKN